MMRKSWIQHFLFPIFCFSDSNFRIKLMRGRAGESLSWNRALQLELTSGGFFVHSAIYLRPRQSSTQPLTCGELGRANYFGTARIGKGSSAENLQDAKPGVIAHFPAGFTKCWCWISSFRGLRRCHHLLCFL